MKVHDVYQVYVTLQDSEWYHYVDPSILVLKSHSSLYT